MLLPDYESEEDTRAVAGPSSISQGRAGDRQRGDHHCTYKECCAFLKASSSGSLNPPEASEERVLVETLKLVEVDIRHQRESVERRESGVDLRSEQDKEADYCKALRRKERAKLWSELCQKRVDEKERRSKSNTARCSNSPSTQAGPSHREERAPKAYWETKEQLTKRNVRRFFRSQDNLSPSASSSDE